MDGLGGALSSLFTSGGGIMKLLSGGLLGAGEIGNIIEQRKKAQYQNQVMNLINNPGALARLAASNEKPLDNSLVQSVGNTVQGQMAERGLAQAPGIFAASESQALAPFVQQNQQVAMDAVLRALGLPASTFGNPQDMSGAMKLFMDAIKGGSSTANNPIPWTPTGGWMTPPSSDTPVNPFPSGVVPTFDPTQIIGTNNWSGG